MAEAPRVHRRLGWGISAILSIALVGYPLFQGFPLLNVLILLCIAALLNFALAVPLSFKFTGNGVSSWGLSGRTELRWDEVKACDYSGYFISLKAEGKTVNVPLAFFPSADIAAEYVLSKLPLSVKEKLL